MVKKCAVYTRTGDGGTTSLASGERVRKCCNKLETYGTVDELNSHLGLLLTYVEEPVDRAQLLRCQNLLFAVGASLATAPAGGQAPACMVGPADVGSLESAIDQAADGLPAWRGFTLPGGCRAAAVADVCRTVCRRAERLVYALAETEPVAAEIPVFLNRLSDYLYVLSRRLNNLAGVEENLWTKNSK